MNSFLLGVWLALQCTAAVATFYGLPSFIVLAFVPLCSAVGMLGLLVEDS